MRSKAILFFMLLSATAIAQEAETEHTARGPTRPAQIATLGPIQDGVVRAVKVVEGDRVKRGDLLLQLNDDVQEARIGLTRAAAVSEGELRQAEVQAQEAEAVLARTQAAAARSAATEWEVRHARARLESARAAVQSATDRRKVEQQRLELEIATRETLMIRAPFDGVVTRLDTTAGATLSRTDRPLVVSDLSSIEAVLYLPGNLWPRLRIGNAYPLGLSAPVGQKRNGRLRYIEPVLDAASGRFRAIFVIENLDHTLPAGVEATLEFSEVM